MRYEIPNEFELKKILRDAMMILSTSTCSEYYFNNTYACIVLACMYAFMSAVVNCEDLIPYSNELRSSHAQAHIAMTAA